MSRQWATRPADETYATLADLAEQLRLEAARSATRTYPTNTLSAVAEGYDVMLQGPQGNPLHLTNWAFGQLASAAQAPAGYLQQLPATLAAECVNVGLARSERADQQLLFRANGEAPRIHAITSERYSRIPTLGIVERLQQLNGWGPASHFGTMAPPYHPVAYHGDRDTYVCLVDEARRITDPTDTTGKGLARGIILTNSELGAKRLSLRVFGFRYACANFMLWGFREYASFSMRHLGERIKTAWPRELHRAISAYADSSAHLEEDQIRRASQKRLGATKIEIADLLFKDRVTSRKVADAAYDLAARHEPDPTTAWGMAQGLTRLSQQLTHTDARIDADLAATRVLAYA
jgi:hypothetical protein